MASYLIKKVGDPIVKGSSYNKIATIITFIAVIYAVYKSIKEYNNRSKVLQIEETNKRILFRFSDKRYDVIEELKKSGLYDPEFEKLDYIDQVKRLLNSNPHIEDDLLITESEYGFLSRKQGTVIFEDVEDNSIILRLIIGLNNGMEMCDVANKVIEQYCNENNIQKPYFKREAYKITRNKSDNIVDWYPIEYNKFSDLTKTLRNTDKKLTEDKFIFLEVRFRIQSVRPKDIANIVENLLNNDKYESGVRFDPVYYDL